MQEHIKRAYQFLVENGQSIVANEAATALGQGSEERRQLMLRHPMVQYWIDCAEQFRLKPQIHNGADTCLENWMHKLLSFGVKESDDIRLERLNREVLQFIYNNPDNGFFFNTVNCTITASWLICMGHQDKILTDLISERVHTIHGFIRSRNYDIYVNPAGYPSIPKQRAIHPLENPFLYEDNVWKLPTVHDMFAFANLPAALQNSSIQNKIDDIIAYILDERYQRLYRGYGLMLVPPRTYYSMGWSVHLDHYFENNAQLSQDGVVWAMELMSHFQPARESAWFRKTLQHLQEFEKDGLYEFPARYMNEGKDKYYVGGGHMGLGENRKSKAALKIESTAWMLRILA
jgi:hypothetical protein